jgi:hypothetical protein
MTTSNSYGPVAPHRQAEILNAQVGAPIATTMRGSHSRPFGAHVLPSITSTQAATTKGLIAGPLNLILGFSISSAMPSLCGFLLTGVVGFVGYGVNFQPRLFAKISQPAFPGAEKAEAHAL